MRWLGAPSCGNAEQLRCFIAAYGGKSRSWVRKKSRSTKHVSIGQQRQADRIDPFIAERTASALHRKPIPRPICPRNREPQRPRLTLASNPCYDIFSP